MNELPIAAAPREAVDVQSIMAAFQAKETLDLIAEALADQDEDRRRLAENLQAGSRAVIANLQEQETLRAREGKYGRLMAPLNARVKELSDQEEVEWATRAEGVLELYELAMDSGKSAPDITKFLKPNSAGQERLLILRALERNARKILALRDELNQVVGESDRVKGEYYDSLSKFLSAETIRKASAVVAFEGEIVLDPTKGRSGEARRLAAYHLGQYRQFKQEAKKA